MKCPFCIKEGVKSKVYDCGHISTLLGCSPYYDEEGDYHFHDSNRVRSCYECSNAHRWESIVQKSPCPGCDYGHDEEPVIKEVQRPW